MPLRTLPPYALDRVVRQFHPFIELAMTSATFYASSVLLCALSREAGARALYTDTWKEYGCKQDGMVACYGLCAVLSELAGAGQEWAQMVHHLDERLKLESDDYLRQLHELSTHNFRRVSFLQFSVQSELQEVAKMHKVLLDICVLEEQEKACEHVESDEGSEGR